MREIGCIAGTKHREIRRNAGIPARARILPGLIAGAAVLTACVPPKPNFPTPSPRRPLEQPETLTAEPARTVAHRSVSAITGDIRFLDGSNEDRDLGPIVVYLVPRTGERDRAPADSLPDLVLTSRTEAFSPPLVAVARGQKLVLANEGPLTHGLFSAEIEGVRFDLPPGTRSAPFSVPPRGPIRFYCALHADETFVIFGSPVRHVAVVEAGETYEFDGVESGRYTLTIWSPRVEGPVRDVIADGYTRSIEPVWIDPDLLRPPAVSRGSR
ncbi:MAG: hypothetical protein ACC682_03240 [Gemmatimonadota bacterium]